MKLIFRMSQSLNGKINRDLSRSHPFAAERVGFVACAVAAIEKEGLLILGDTYHPVADDHYLDDPRVGAMMGSAAIRTALQIAYGKNVSMFHVHRHEHYGRPRFSRIDLRESARFVPDFFKVRPAMPHGALVLSHDSMAGLCWLPGHASPVPIDEFAVIGHEFPGLRTTS